MDTITINNVVNEILSLYQQFGNSDYIGEPVSQIEHMCQCSALAQQNGHDDEVILAAFFHDIGHLCEQDKDAVHMGDYGLVDHEKLSVASKITLIHQGGKMTETEARLFELDPLFDIYIALRKWDEEAKLENIPLPSLDRYREMMILHLKGHQ
jgi:predicted HD phosphohydrolase